MASYGRDSAGQDILARQQFQSVGLVKIGAPGLPIAVLPATMPEVELSSLDSRLRKQVDNARKAIENGNPAYAIDICRGILKRSPGCLEIRRILRRAQKTAVTSYAVGLSKAFARVSNAPFRLKSRSLLKTDPLKALEIAEAKLTSNPSDVSTHRTVAETAEALDFPGTAVFARVSILAEEPDNTANVLALGNAYAANGRNRDAVKAGDRALAADPGNAEAQALVKRASVSESIDSGGWESSGDYRGKLKDEKVAIELEAENRGIEERDVLENQVQSITDRIVEEPENTTLYRELIRKLRQTGDLVNALSWLEKLRALKGSESDADIDREYLELKIDVLRRNVDDCDSEYKSNPDNPGLREARDTAVADLSRFEKDHLATLVGRYPNDFHFRFEFGRCLFEQGDLDGAARQFQLAQRSPALKVSATLDLGKVFKQGGKFDLAAEQFESAQELSGVNDDLKKEIAYELAECFEKMGDDDRAIKEYKSIYASDVSFRDVSEKIDAFYS